MSAEPVEFEDWRWLHFERQGRFVEEYFARLVAAMPKLMARKNLPDWVLRKLAVESLKPAGYWARGSPMRKNGKMNKIAMKQADRLRNLPAVQEARDAKFAPHGFTLDRAAQTLAEIAFGEAKQTITKTTEDGATETTTIEPTAGERLRAIDIRIRATVGYAPTKSVQANIDADKFFKNDAFEKPPPINVTPTNGKAHA